MLYSSQNFVETLNKTMLPFNASDHLHRTSSQYMYANFGAKKGGTMKMAIILPFFPFHDASRYIIVFQDLQLKLSADHIP